MATTKNGKARSSFNATDVGLLANGSSGAWSIDVDEATAGPDRWFLQIEGPSIYCYFEIPSLDVVGKIAAFLGVRPSVSARQMDRSAAADWELIIGTDPHTPVRLLRDDEFDDRIYLLVGRTDSPIVRLTLRGDDVKCVVAALDQIRDDLTDG